MDKEIFIDHFKGRDVKASSIFQAQQIARDCLKHMSDFLKPGLSREDIHEECARYMKEKGSQSWWIHNDPALILFGPHTAYSGRQDPAPLFEGLTIQNDDLITIDVAPCVEGGWGDMARSFIMEDGKIVDWKDCHNKLIKEAMELELELHELYKSSLKPGMTFAMLHTKVEEYISKRGYRNLDYHGNFGHTIENHPDDRVTIAEGVGTDIIAYDKPITFEPHICKIGSDLGIKYENMYFYHEGKVIEVK